MHICRICGNENDNTLYSVKEMQFGTMDVFEYFQCSNCSCLQIKEVPSELSKYYSNNYYSLKKINFQSKGINALIKTIRDRYSFFGKGIIGRILFYYFPANTNIISSLKVNRLTRCLDVGCGNGQLLLNMHRSGFVNLAGTDPFLEDELNYGSFRIFNKTIFELENKWDLIMFHHSFEHIPNPFETLVKVHQLLDTNGICLIRIPTVSSYAWEYYKENWVQLDAPRHIFLHSIQSMQLLANKCGFKIENIKYDSTALQFWGSEQYKAGISLNSNESWNKNSNASMFNKMQIKKYKKTAIKLNIEKRGDSVAFVLRKADL